MCYARALRDKLCRCTPACCSALQFICVQRSGNAVLRPSARWHHGSTRRQGSEGHHSCTSTQIQARAFSSRTSSLVRQSHQQRSTLRYLCAAGPRARSSLLQCMPSSLRRATSLLPWANAQTRLMQATESTASPTLGVVPHAFNGVHPPHARQWRVAHVHADEKLTQEVDTDGWDDLGDVYAFRYLPEDGAPEDGLQVHAANVLQLPATAAHSSASVHAI